MYIKICFITAFAMSTVQLEAVKDCPRCKIIEAERAKEPFKDAGYYNPSKSKDQSIAMQDDTWTPTDELHSSPIHTGTGPNDDINPDIERANDLQEQDFEDENPSD